MYPVWVSEKKNSDYFAIQPQLIGLYTRDRVRLLYGTNWILNTIRLILIFKWLKQSYKHKGIAITSVSRTQAEKECIQIELVAQAWS